MTKSLHAYFKSENDAESAHADLHRLQVKNIRVDEMPDDTEGLHLVPIISNSLGSGAFTGGSIGPVAFNEEMGAVGEREDTRKHLLEFEVAEEDYQEAVQILKEHEGYVDKGRLK